MNSEAVKEAIRLATQEREKKAATRSNMNKDFWGSTKADLAIECIRAFEPPKGYYLAFSGGKDSCVIKALAVQAQIRFDAHYSVTTIDPPEIVYFIRQFHPDVIWEHPEKPFLSRLQEKGFHLRNKRWCCSEYKENGGRGRIVLTGIRKEESNKRAGRRMVENCLKNGSKTFVNPIIDWTEADVWEFIRENNIPYCRLYDEGFKRIGCVLCPMNRQRLREAGRWPRMKANFERAFVRLWEKNKSRESYMRWPDGKKMFEWWLSPDGGGRGDPDQFVMFE